MANVMNTGNEGVATDETGSLIAASKVNGMESVTTAKEKALARSMM